MSHRTAIPASWTTTPLGDVVSPKVAQSGPPVRGTFTYVDISSIDNQAKRVRDPKTLLSSDAPSRARQVLATNDVLVSMTRPNLNAVAIVSPELDGAIGSTGFDVLRARAVDPKWLYYIVQTADFVDAMSRVVQGALYPAVRPKDVRSFMIPLAPLAEQRRIVAKIEELFSALDAGVAALERARANLKRYRASLLKAAVEGRLTADWRAQHPDVEPAATLLDRILRERRAKWEADQRAKFAAAGKPPPKNWQAKYVEPAAPDTTDLPQLPTGWCWASVEQLSMRSEYGTSVKCNYNGIGPPVLRIPNIAEGEIEVDDLKFAAMPLELTVADSLVVGDLLMCRTNGSVSLIGKAAVVRRDFGRPHSFASYLLRFRFADSRWMPLWVHAFVSSTWGRQFIEQNAASSAGQHNISLALMHRMPVPLPPRIEADCILREIDERLDSATESERPLAIALRRAARLRQSILKQAFSGRLVPQDPADEPASALLARLRANPRTIQDTQRPQRKEKRHARQHHA